MEKFDTFKEKQKVGNNLHIHYTYKRYVCHRHVCIMLVIQFNGETMKPIN